MTQKYGCNSPPVNKSWTQRLYEGANPLFEAIPPPSFSDGGAAHMRCNATAPDAPAGELVFDEFHEKIGGTGTVKWTPKKATLYCIADAGPAPVTSEIRTDNDSAVPVFGYRFGATFYGAYSRTAQCLSSPPATPKSLGMPDVAVDIDTDVGRDAAQWQMTLTEETLDESRESTNGNDRSINGLLLCLYWIIITRLKYAWILSGRQIGRIMPFFGSGPAEQLARSPAGGCK